MDLDMVGGVASDYIASIFVFFFSSRRRHTRLQGDWSSDVCSSDLPQRELGKKKRGRCRNMNRGSIKSGVLPQREKGSIKTRALPQREMGSIKSGIGRASCRERV